MDQISKFIFYSLGIVAANKQLSTDVIEVTPIEGTNFLNGEITDNAVPITTSGLDASGANYSTNIASTASIRARWLPIGVSNRITSPDVRRGERVMIYRFADTDEFWWSTLRDDMDLRKLETVVYAFSDTKDESAKTDATHSYYFEVSTHQGFVHLHTSTSNGEPYAYDIQINAKNGFIQIQDDQGNFITFNTAEHRISMVNQDGSVIEVNKTNINLGCSATITMDCNDLVVNAKNSIHATTNSTTVDSPTNTINGSQNTINGLTTINGNLTASGAGGGAGVATFNGSMNVSQNVTAPTFTGFLNGSISGSDSD